MRKSGRIKSLNKEQIEIYTTEGGTPHLDGAYTVFGEVISGMEVLEAIADTETGYSEALDAEDVPLIPILLIRASVKE